MPTNGVEWIPANQIEELRTLFESKESINKTEKTEEVPFVEARPITQTAQQEAVQQPIQHLRRRVTPAVLSVFCSHLLFWLQS